MVSPTPEGTVPCRAVKGYVAHAWDIHHDWEYCELHVTQSQAIALMEREFVTSNDNPRILAYRYNIEASIDVS
jgi:hypothetical protein